MPAQVWDVGRAAFGLEDRDPEGPMSVVGRGRVAGEVGSDDSSAAATGSSRVALLAGVNLFLGMFNFVPLLPLTAATSPARSTRRYAAASRRLFRRPDPGHFDVAKLLPVAYVIAGSAGDDRAAGLRRPRRPVTSAERPRAPATGRDRRLGS